MCCNVNIKYYLLTTRTLNMNNKTLRKETICQVATQIAQTWKLARQLLLRTSVQITEIITMINILLYVAVCAEISKKVQWIAHASYSLTNWQLQFWLKGYRCQYSLLVRSNGWACCLEDMHSKAPSYLNDVQVSINLSFWNNFQSGTIHLSPLLHTKLWSSV